VVQGHVRGMEQKQQRHQHVRGWPSNGVVATMTPSEAVDWEKNAIVAP
jgi:hypothetical protein